MFTYETLILTLDTAKRNTYKFSSCRKYCKKYLRVYFKFYYHTQNTIWHFLYFIIKMCDITFLFIIKSKNRYFT